VTAAAQAGRFAWHGPDSVRAAVGFEDVVEPVAQALADFSRGLGASPGGEVALVGGGRLDALPDAVP
jgi:hypothetical protein